jgi:hypothetical protein
MDLRATELIIGISFVKFYDIVILSNEKWKEFSVIPA